MSVLKPSYDERFIQQFVGTNMISNARVAIVELIANAWDAGARRVDIQWPVKSEDNAFYILDNGHGMDKKQFKDRYMTISYNREKEQTSFVMFPKGIEAGKRKAYGKNGMGRLAAFCFADSYQVETSADGKISNAYHMTRKEGSDPLEATEIQTQHAFQIPGTKISTADFKCRSLDIADLRKEIGMRFLSDPNFQIYVNNEQVNLLDIPDLNVHRFTANLEGIEPIQIIAIDTARPDGTTKQHGVAWHVNGRLVGECSWKGPSGERFLDGRKTIAKRFTFLVKADCLSDFIKPDWTGFQSTEPLYQTVFDAVLEAIQKFISEFFKDKRTETLNNIKEANQTTLKKLSPIELQNWEGFVKETQEKCDNVSEDVLEDISKILANMLMANSRYALLHKLGNYNPSQLDDLDKILTEWTVDMAKIVLDELAVRMVLIKDLEIKVRSTLTDELRDLQPLFERGLWIFGPEYESIHFTSNKGITHILRTLFNIDEQGSRNRPDFVVLPDGNSSIGAYSVPRFSDDDGGEAGIGKLVIVELKKPGIAIGSEQKDQCWKYVKEFKSKGAIANDTDVICFVLGSSIDPLENSDRKEDRTIIRPLTYDTVITRAHSRLLNLKQEVESAPFLLEHGITEFVERDKEIKAQTEMEGV